MVEIDSDALTLARRILGLGYGGEQRAQLDDGHVSQVLDIAPVVRRSRAVRGSGLFTCVMENAHAAANSQTSTINPYAPGALANAGFPGTVPAGFDVWIVSISGMLTVGAIANFTAGVLFQDILLDNIGMSVDQAGAAALPAAGFTEHYMARFDDAVNEGGRSYIISEAGQPYVRIGERLARNNADITWATTSGGAITCVATVLLGLFPSGLGQDVAL